MDATSARRAFEHALATQRPVFGEFFLARLLGLEIGYSDEACTVRLQPRDFMFNPQGSVHGGVIAMVLDIAMGHLLNRAAGPGLTLEMKTQYLVPMRSAPALATGRFLARGRKVAFLWAELRGEDGLLHAHATATWKSMSDSARSPEPHEGERT